jgi:hypothetical protein
MWGRKGDGYVDVIRFGRDDGACAKLSDPVCVNVAGQYNNYVAWGLLAGPPCVSVHHCDLIWTAW